MTPEQRQAARERCAKATPADSLFVRHNKEIWRHLGGTNDNGSDEDFDYNARTDLPAALDALDAADSHQAQSDLRISNQRTEINRLTHELRGSEIRFQVFTTWRRECEMWRDKTSAFWEIYRLKKRIAELSKENSQMARMLAEPSENQELKARIAELTADAEFLTTPERLAEIIGDKNARIVELESALRDQKLWIERRLKDGPIETRGQHTGYLGSQHPSGYAAVLVPDWEMRQKLDGIDAAMKPEDKPC